MISINRETENIDHIGFITIQKWRYACAKVNRNFGDLLVQVRFCRNGFTVEIGYNGPEGTEEFWLLNPNVVKSNYHCFLISSFHKKNFSKMK